MKNLILLSLLFFVSLAHGANTKIPTSMLAEGASITKVTDFNGSGKQLMSTSGYQRLPGGLILQWAQGTSMTSNYAQIAQTINFPIAFPNGVLAVHITQISTTCGDVQGGDTLVQSWTLSSVLIEKGGNGGNYSCTSTPQIFAIGY